MNTIKVESMSKNRYLIGLLAASLLAVILILSFHFGKVIPQPSTSPTPNPTDNPSGAPTPPTTKNPTTKSPTLTPTTLAPTA